MFLKEPPAQKSEDKLVGAFLEIKEKQSPGVRILWCSLPANFHKERWRIQAPPGSPHPLPWVFALHEKNYSSELFAFSMLLCQAPPLWWPGSFLFSHGGRKTPCNYGRLRNRANNRVTRWGTGLQLFGLFTLKLTNFWPSLLWYSTKLYHQRTTSMEIWFWQSTQVTSGAVTSAGVLWYAPISLHFS